MTPEEIEKLLQEQASAIVALTAGVSDMQAHIDSLIDTISDQNKTIGNLLEQVGSHNNELVKQRKEINGLVAFATTAEADRSAYETQLDAINGKLDMLTAPGDAVSRLRELERRCGV